MDYQQAHLDSLNKVIAVQNELIAFLKAEIERLNTASIFINTPNTITSPNTNPGVSPYPYLPFIGSPITPAGDPHLSPLNPPYYTTTSGQTTTYLRGTITSIGDPPGSISSGSTSSPPVPNWPETPESLKAKRKK